MNLHRIARFASCLAAAVLAAGCAGSESGAVLKGPEDGGGRLTFALAGDYVPGSTHFKIRLFKGVPTSLAQKAYFESPCTPPNLGFTVTDLSIATGYVVVYDAFSTSDCAVGNLVARGIRGEIEVTQEGTGGAVYYIQVNQVGAITAFPVPDAALLDSGVTCQADSECQGTIDCADPTQCRFPFQEACTADEACAGGMKWVQYRVHPQAKCVGSICRLQTLFPLNVQSDRAFHVAVSGPGGTVALLGGFAQYGGTGLTVGTRTVTETFATSTSLFDVMDLGTDLGNAVGLMGASMLDGNRLVLVGGSPAVGVEVDGDSTVPLPRPQLCTGACPVTLSPYAYVIDLSTGAATRSSVGFSTALALVETIAGDAGPEAFVREGLVQEAADRIAAGRNSYRCVPDADGLLTCVVIAGSENATQRYASSSACVNSNASGECTDVVVMGGNTATAGAFAELYSKSAGTVRDLTPGGIVPDAMFGAVAVVAGGQVWTFGGTSGKNGRKPDVDPMAINVDPAAGTINAAASGLSGADLALLQRLHHQATPLADGKTVLITGGLGPDKTPLASAVLVEASQGHLAIKSVIGDMALPRIDHRAVRIQGGLMDGAVLITGGLSDLKGAAKYAAGAEIFVP